VAHFFSSDGVDIAYIVAGQGDPILLIHGFASSTAVNWGSTGWIEALVADGRLVVALDVRGHGESAKLYDPADYRLGRLAADAGNLLDHLKIRRADVMGYSMGARIATVLTLDRPEVVRSLVIGGMGSKLVTALGGEEQIAEALEAPVSPGTDNPVAQNYRAFAERTHSDLRALAACMRAEAEPIPAERLHAIHVPVLVAVGTLDDRVGSAAGLAELIPGAHVLDIVGRDHMLATGDRQFKAGVLDFLRDRT
jgi:pimeloyl-ACP methyl ester carboxylesterase